MPAYLRFLTLEDQGKREKIQRRKTCHHCYSDPPSQVPDEIHSVVKSNFRVHWNNMVGLLKSIFSVDT